VECEEQNVDQGGFAFRRKRLGAAAGGKGIGLSWFELPPGKKAFPSHFHLANEEAMFILEGEACCGSVRRSSRCAPATTSPFRRPSGHQVINRSQAPSASWRSPPCWNRGRRYPDSKKIGVLARVMGWSRCTSRRRVDYYLDEK